MILYADIPGERLDAFLARMVPDLSRSAAQKLMGHADIQTTANIYTHQDDDTLLQAAQQMGAAPKDDEGVAGGVAG